MSVWVPRTPSRPLTWPLRRVSWRICRADISRRRRPFDPPGYQCSSRQEPDRNQSHRHALRQCAGHLAWGFILALGIIAALNQLHIAQNVLNAVLYAALAALAGIAVVAVGGGGIKAMSQRWEAAAARFDAEMLRIAAARNAPSLTDQASQAMPADPGRSSCGATGTGPQPAEPYPQADDGGDHPTGTGS